MELSRLESIHSRFYWNALSCLEYFSIFFAIYAPDVFEETLGAV
jgi:hypothetical protein